MARSSIQDIADLAGVSKMTVSRVLRGEGGSRHQEQILEAARRLDYIPVRPIVQNRRARTRVIGILEDDEFLFHTAVGSQTLSGVVQTTFANGYDLLMLHPQHDHPLDIRKVQFLDKRCEAFIFVVPHENREILELLVENEIPAVTCYSVDVPKGVSWVIPDNEGAISEAVQLLVSLGHRNIAFRSGPPGHSDARQRTATFIGCLDKLGLPLSSESFLPDLEMGSASESEFLQQKLERLRNLVRSGVTAIICHNDERALSLWEQAQHLGLKIPEDLSLIGVDDIPEAQQRGLTTFDNPFSEIGRTATNSLLSLLNGGSSEENCHTIPMRFIERSSVATARAHAVLKP